MIAGFSDMEEAAIDNFKGGKGTIFARMYNDERNRVLIARLPPGTSIGMHTHAGSQETVFVIEGDGTVICDGKIGKISKDMVHICPDGSSHSIENNGESDLILLGSIVQF